MAYYIYRHVRIDSNDVFYIGKGTTSKGSFKVKYQRAHSMASRNRHWNSITKKTEYRIDIIFEDDCEQTVFDKETEFINIYGRKDLGLGKLCNLTDGGDGESGRVFSIDHKRRISEAKIGVYAGENNPNYGKGLKGDKNGMWGKSHSAETKAKIKELFSDGRWAGENNGMFGTHRFGKLNPMYGKKQSEATREKIRLKALERNADKTRAPKINRYKKVDKNIVRYSAIIFDTQNFVYYYSIKDAADTLNVKYGTIYEWLCGKKGILNKSNLILV